MSVKLEYAYKQVENELELVHVGDVVGGLNCNCTCPSCGKKLIAKNKPLSKVKHHFQHYQAEECAYAVETSLHLLAKEIIAESKQIMLPGDKRVVKEEYPSYGSLSQRTKIFLTPELKKVDSVTVEKKFDSIVPDLLLNINGSRLLVEIYVTHKVDQTKKNYLETNKLETIEIDLHKEKRDLTRELLKEYILNAKNSYWIFNDILEIKKREFELELQQDRTMKKEFKEKKYKSEQWHKNKTTIKWKHQMKYLDIAKKWIHGKSNDKLMIVGKKHGYNFFRQVSKNLIQDCPTMHNPEIDSCLGCQYNPKFNSESKNRIIQQKDRDVGYVKCLHDMFLNRYVPVSEPK